jgi:hypothetical protein
VAGLAAGILGFFNKQFFLFLKSGFPSSANCHSATPPNPKNGSHPIHPPHQLHTTAKLLRFFGVLEMNYKLIMSCIVSLIRIYIKLNTFYGLKK